MTTNKPVAPNHGYSAHKKEIVNRVNRAEGQVRGVAKMIESDSYCIDVLTQISAAKAALDKVAVELLRDHAQHCMISAATKQDKITKADELVDAVDRLIRS